MPLPDFTVPWPFDNPHLQTLGAAVPLYVRPPKAARDEPLRFPLSEGGALHAFGWWHEGVRPTVLLLHGVGGSVSSRYVVRAAKGFFAAGFHVVRLNARGAGESIPDAPALYHAGLTEDLRVACRALRARTGQVGKLAVVGFSLGGHCTLRFAAEESGTSALMDAAVTLSAPLDLALVSRLMNRPLNLPYRAYLVRGLKRQARDFARVHPQLAARSFDASALRKIHTIWAYDDLVVAPMHGFGTAASYYGQMSAGPLTGRVTHPLLMIHAEDDPIVPGHTVRPFLAQRAKSIEVAISQRGGHVGWFSGLSETTWLRTWAMDHAIDFLGRTLGS
jgi:predicted alpha/beta-fold hydrolase